MLEGYISIRLSTVNPEKTLPLDLFLPVNGKAVRYAASGQDLGRDRFQRLKGHQVSKLLIKIEDETRYREFLEGVMKEAENNKKLALSERTATMASGAEAAAADLMEKPDDKIVYERSAKQLERFGNFLKSYDGSVVEIFRHAGTKENDYVFHGAQVAALAYLLCVENGVSKAAQMMKSVMTGCFLHDIAAEKAGLPQGLASDLNEEQKKLWLDHPAAGARMLGDKDFVDRLVLDIIMQHEEIPNGSGFPRGLNGTQMDPVSICVSLANNFDHYSLKFKGDKSTAMKTYMLEELGKYDFDLVQKLQKIVNKLG